MSRPESTYKPEVSNASLKTNTGKLIDYLTFFYERGYTLLDQEEPLDYLQWLELYKAGFALLKDMYGQVTIQLLWFRVMERGIHDLIHLIEISTLEQIRETACLQGDPAYYWVNESDARKWIDSILNQLTANFELSQHVQVARLVMDAYIAYCRRFQELLGSPLNMTIARNVTLNEIAKARFPYDKDAQMRWKEEAVQAISA